MPIRRLNSNGVWKSIAAIYRLANPTSNTGVWKPIASIYRLRSDGSWFKIFSGVSNNPVITTAPTLRSNNTPTKDPSVTDSTTWFTHGNNITLTRGSYTKTTNDSNTKYTLKIIKNINPIDATSGGNADISTVVKTQDFLGTTTSPIPSISYLVDITDAGYYFGGIVEVNNTANVAGSKAIPFYVVNNEGRARIGFTINSFGYTDPTTNGATFSWSIPELTSGQKTTYIYSQIIKIKRTSDDFIVYTSPNIASSVNSYIISDSNIQPNGTSYYATIEIIAKDGSETTNYPTIQTRNSASFSTTYLPPVNTVAPVITPINNRGRLPLGVQLTSNTGTWTGTDGTTTYKYDWYQATPPNSEVASLNAGSQRIISSAVNDTLRVIVSAKNSNTNYVGQTSQTYSMDPKPTIFDFTPTYAVLDTPTNFSFKINNYPTQYSISWGDGTSGITTYCRDETIFVGTVQCPGGYRTYRRCYSDAQYTNLVSNVEGACNFGPASIVNAGTSTQTTFDVSGNTEQINVTLSKTYVTGGFVGPLSSIVVTAYPGPVQFFQPTTGGFEVVPAIGAIPTINSITLGGNSLIPQESTATVALTGAGIGPYYQLWYTDVAAGSAAPSNPSNTLLDYKAANNINPIYATLSLLVDRTYYFWARSSNQAITSDISGTATSGRFGNWSTALSSTTRAPAFTVSCSPTSGNTNTTFTASKTQTAGNPTPSYTFQWQVQNPSTGVYQNVSAGTPANGQGETYTPSSTYANTNIRCQVIGQNMFGTVTRNTTPVLLSSVTAAPTTAAPTAAPTTAAPTAAPTTAAPSANFTAGPGTTSCPAGSTVLAQGTFTPSFTGQTIVINTGAACGTQSVYIYTSGMQWSWKCCSA